MRGTKKDFAEFAGNYEKISEQIGLPKAARNGVYAGLAGGF
jgi:hypothetical protein